MSGNLFDALFTDETDLSRKLMELGDGRNYSYGDAKARSGQFANVLRDHGVEPGDRVAVQVEKSADALFLYLGCLRAGAVYLPLNTGYVESELEYFLSDAEPRLVVCAPSSQASMEAIAAKAGVASTLCLATEGGGSLALLADSAPEVFETISRSKDDLAAILYTSGTTGRSKGAMITHGNLTSNAEALVSYWRFTQDDVLLHALPIFHVHGLFVATNVTMMARGSMIFLPGFDLAQVLSFLPRASVMMGVPTFYSRLLSSEAFGKDLVGHMRLFISGSAPLSPETHKAFEERTGHAILERYGMTETGMNTSNPYDGARRPGTVGFALPGVEIRVADRETGAPVAEGEVGIIEIRGPNVFKGYWRMPDKTKEEFRADGFFISGDLGRIDEQGYLNIVGRDKDLIISGGYNVYPAEVEAALDGIGGISESAVIGAPHADFGEGVTAIAALKNGVQLSEEEVRQELAGQMAKYKVPKRVFFVDALPRNAMGKIEKKKLRETYRDIYQ